MFRNNKKKKSNFYFFNFKSNVHLCISGGGDNFQAAHSNFRQKYREIRFDLNVERTKTLILGRSDDPYINKLCILMSIMLA